MTRIRVEPLTLTLIKPFKISYGTSYTRQAALIHLEVAGLAGIGEAPIVPYYHETFERIAATCQQAEALLVGIQPEAIEENRARLEGLSGDVSPAAISAIDCALHDLWGKSQGQAVFQLWGLENKIKAYNSYTLAIDKDKEAYIAQIIQQRDKPVLKLKLGSGDLDTDYQLVQLARQYAENQQLCVDANGAWTAEEALQIIPKIAEFDLLFVEQPIAKNKLEDWVYLRERLSAECPELIADESVQGLDSLSDLLDIVDGINIKLAKCRGLAPAKEMIRVAKAKGLKVMLGCMVSTSVDITAIAHLAPLADYLDLDGNLLIKDDPYEGVIQAQGRIQLRPKAGLGVQKRQKENT
ncbi:dipeptide epimerase [Anaerolineales bacterium]